MLTLSIKEHFTINVEEMFSFLPIIYSQYMHMTNNCNNLNIILLKTDINISLIFKVRGILIIIMNSPKKPSEIIHINVQKIQK